MCGRFSFTSTKEEVEQTLDLTLGQELQKSYKKQKVKKKNKKN